MAPVSPTPPVWQVEQVRVAVLGWGRLVMPVWVVGLVAGGSGILNPPTKMVWGAPPPPSQLGAEAVPVPGQAWRELQSCVPGVEVNAE